MSLSLDGRIAVITGAATGIGRAIAIAAAASGARLVLGDVAADPLAETVASARECGADVRSRPCDVREQHDVDALVDLAVGTFGRPEIVFANAGIEGPAGLPWEVEESDVMRVMDVNFTGVWRMMKATIPAMIAHRQGSFVATASVAGMVGADGLAPYVASKHALVGLVRSAAISAAPFGVRINALCPGMVDTPLLDRLAGDNPAMRAALMARNPMQRLGRVEEIADAALWLASDRASYVTGHTLAIDGGYVAQ